MKWSVDVFYLEYRFRDWQHVVARGPCGRTTSCKCRKQTAFLEYASEHVEQGVLAVNRIVHNRDRRIDYCHYGPDGRMLARLVSGLRVGQSSSTQLTKRQVLEPRLSMSRKHQQQRRGLGTTMLSQVEGQSQASEGRECATMTVRP